MNTTRKKILATIVACATGLYITACVHSSVALASSANTTLRVATWNINSKDHPDISKMTDLLQEKNIDIVGCQEFDVLNGRNNYDMVQAFVNKTYPYVHFAKGRDFSDGAFGVGIISKYDLLEESAIPIESTGSKATKVLERIVFEKEGQKIALYNTHLSWENLDLRRRQMKEVIDRVNSDPIKYKIITADYNADQHDYEYSMFLDNFTIANGHNGQWFDTYGANDDPSMKVFTIDNIIATKNMKITHVDMVKSKLSDHYLLLADLELLDHYEGTAKTNNLALGQGVTVSSTNQESSPYLLVNYDKTAPWLSDNHEQQELIIELDRLYDLTKTVVNWGNTRATNYKAAVSVDGKTFTEIKEITTDKGQKDTLQISKVAKFIKFTLTQKSNPATPYEITEIEAFGKPVVTTPNVTNLLKNGDMEFINHNTPQSWDLIISKETAPSLNYTFTNDTTEKYNGKRSAKLTRIGQAAKDEKGDGALVQTIPLEPNKRYQLSFWHKTDTLHSGAFTYEINQKNAHGETIPTHLAKLNDNLNLSKDWKQFKYNFTTSPTTNNATIALHVVKDEGSLWLDNITVKEVIPTEMIFLTAEKQQLSIGEKTKLHRNTTPKNATDIELHWVSSNNAVATVDEQGTVTASGAGKAYIGLVSDSDLIAESKILITVK